MANSWFDFKQFKVEQQDAAFKVGTDACLLASWINTSAANTILDIGTGSGVIALMLAQKCKATIDGIDIDIQSSLQAQLNFEQSPWSNRLTSIHQSLDDYAITTSKSYDLIVSNPPYFVGSTKNLSERKSNARHEGELNLEALLSGSFKLSAENGNLALVLPYDRYEDLIQEAERSKWHLSEQLYIMPKENKAVNRFIAVFSKTKPETVKTEELILYKETKVYSQEAIELLKPYYLHL